MNKVNKKSEAGLVIILIIIILLFFFGWLINMNQRECRTNKDCGSESYCGSDFSCHEYPNIQKTIIQYNFVLPSIIIGIAIIIAAILFRWGRSRSMDQQNRIHIDSTNNSRATEEIEEISEPYYKADGNVKTP